MESLLSIQSAMQEVEEAAVALRDAAGRLRSMNILYDALFYSDSVSEVPVDSYLVPLIDQIVETFSDIVRVNVRSRIDNFPLPVKVLSSLGIVINELVTNVMKHAFTENDEGTITITAEKSGGKAVIIVEDNGVGLPDFVTVENADSFGLQLVGLLADQLNGALSVERGNGTKIILEFAV